MKLLGRGVGRLAAASLTKQFFCVFFDAHHFSKCGNYVSGEYASGKSGCFIIRHFVIRHCLPAPVPPPKQKVLVP